jgi:hypothetical protein
MISARFWEARTMRGIYRHLSVYLEQICWYIKMMQCPNQRSNEFEQNSTQFARETSRFVIIFKRFIWNFVLGFGVCSFASEGIVMANESTICSLFQE